MPRRLRLVLLAAALYGVALLLIAAWPTHVDENVNVLNSAPARWLIDLGIAPHNTYRLIEASANVVLFVPFGVLLMLASLRVTWLRAVGVALVVSCGIEILQAVALPGRTANAGDVAANVLGAAIGASGVRIWRAVARRMGGVQDEYGS